MSTFSGLNTATTALWAQRRALDVTGQNIANVNTEGYSRQRTDLQSLGGTAVPAFHSVSREVGGGVSADNVLRIRDVFLEGRAQLEHGTAARLTAENQALGFVEQAFREPGTTGIQSMLDEVWNGWGAMANNTPDLPARSEILSRTQTLVDGFRSTQGALDAQWSQTRENLTTLVDEVNAVALEVADLNSAIQRATQAGLPANELSDKRDVLVMKLADQVGGLARPGADGMVDVLVGGAALVAGGTALGLRLIGSSDPDTIAGDPPRLVTTAGNSAVRPGGTAQGQLNTLNDIIPSHRDALDSLAQKLATAMNDQHRNGFDLDGAPGGDVFGSTSGPITASTLTLLISDPRKLAASSAGPDASGPALDNRNADAIAQLRRANPGIDFTYRTMIVELGIRAGVTERNLEIQSVIAAQVDAARDSVAGVNLDEEMTNMLSFQHAYSAAGRMVTAIDETLDVLINRTGLVGR